mmetsp:Transcript_5421/g.11386  ORF Transcript_5421/g.11386 Transcript_5421/m.11386 type:complete len:129 (+) Transcript_5421:112-498(+)
MLLVSTRLDGSNPIVFRNPVLLLYVFWQQGSSNRKQQPIIIVLSNDHLRRTERNHSNRAHPENLLPASGDPIQSTGRVLTDSTSVVVQSFTNPIGLLATSFLAEDKCDPSSISMPKGSTDSQYPFANT